MNKYYKRNNRDLSDKKDSYYKVKSNGSLYILNYLEKKVWSKSYHKNLKALKKFCRGNYISLRRITEEEMFIEML